MRPTRTAWTPSSILLAAAGATLILAGLYFLLLRSALLPEDVRYINLSTAELAAVRPRFEAWPSHIFRVMGGYVLGTGVLTVTLAVTSFRAHYRAAAVGALIGGSASIGLMAAVNFAISSDLKWVLLGMALLWGSSLVLYGFETGSVRASRSSQSERKLDV